MKKPTNMQIHQENGKLMMHTLPFISLYEAKTIDKNISLNDVFERT